MTNIEKAIIASGLSQKEIATLVGVSQPTISDWKKEKILPSGKNLIKLANVLNVSIDYLLSKHVNGFALRLKELRQEQHLTQQDVAAMLSIDRTTYVRYENGNTEPPFSILIDLSSFFNVSIDYLLGYEPSKQEEQDIKKELHRILHRLEQEQGIFYGPDPLDEDTRELLIASLERSIRIANALEKKRD